MSQELQIFFAIGTLITEIASVNIALLGVLVGAVIGALGIGVTRTAKAAQDTAVAAATDLLPSADPRAVAEPSITNPGPASSSPADVDKRWTVYPAGGEEWFLVNNGPGVAVGVEPAGFTASDSDRLTDRRPPGNHDVPVHATVRFRLHQHLVFRGPAVLVVTWLEPGDDHRGSRRMQRVRVDPGQRR